MATCIRCNSHNISSAGYVECEDCGKEFYSDECDQLRAFVEKVAALDTSATWKEAEILRGVIAEARERCGMDDACTEAPIADDDTKARGARDGREAAKAGWRSKE